MEFYRTVTTTKLLRNLVDFKHDIFVTQQIVKEAERNKLKVVHRFLTESVGTLPVTIRIDLPSLLRGPELLDRLQHLQEAAAQFQQSVEAAILAALTQVSHSTDAVSQTLKPIFDRAIAVSEDELERARMRRELGHPPGKGRDPLGERNVLSKWDKLRSR
jgi:enoyl-CoA hydratase/carnithine racemase